MTPNNKVIAWWRGLPESKQAELRSLIAYEMSQKSVEERKAKWGAEGFHEQMVKLSKKAAEKRMKKK